MDVKNVQGNETIYEMLNKYTQEVTETQDEFIFSALSKYAMDNFNIVVEKEELVQAIHLIKMCNETGTDLRQYHSTATDGTELYRKGYNTGFEAGIQEVRNRLEKTFN